MIILMYNLLFMSSIAGLEAESTPPLFVSGARVNGGGGGGLKKCSGSYGW